MESPEISAGADPCDEPPIGGSCRKESSRERFSEIELQECGTGIKKLIAPRDEASFDAIGVR
jgi:hypothetical protein